MENHEHWCRVRTPKTHLIHRYISKNISKNKKVNTNVFTKKVSDDAEKIVSLFEKHRPSGKPFGSGIRKEEVISADNLIKKYGFEEVKLVTQVMLVAKYKKYRKDFEFCPRADSFRLLDKKGSMMFEKLRNFGETYITQEEKMKEFMEF